MSMAKEYLAEINRIYRDLFTIPRSKVKISKPRQAIFADNNIDRAEARSLHDQVEAYFDRAVRAYRVNQAGTHDEIGNRILTKYFENRT